MAANTSFKQQCPSCEAMVTIRDDNLIGKKIDCPKCKYRFVVEEPTDEEEEFEQEEAPKKKGKAAKGKAGKRRDDDDDDRPRKKEGGSKKLVLGLVIGGAALILLIAAGVLLIMNMGGSADTSKKSPPVATGARGGGGRGAAAQNKDDDDGAPKDDKKKQEAPKSSGDAIATNLLPNDTEFVLNIMPQEFLASPLGRTAFDTPGAFQRSQFQSTFGFPLDDLERVLAAANLAQKWNFFVVRTSKPVKPDAVKKALHLKKADDSPAGFEYFTIASEWLNKEAARLNDPNLSKLPIPITPGPHPLAVRFHDPQTIVIADMAPMKKFLADKEKPAELTKKAEEKKQAADSDGGGGRGGPGGMQGMMGRGMMRGRPGGDEGGGPQGMEGMMNRGMGGRGSATATDSPPPAASKYYLTIKPSLKAMLDRMEAKGPVVCSLAFDTTQWKESLKSQIQFQFINVEQVAMPKFVGFAVGMKEKFTGLIGEEFADANVAKEYVNLITGQLPQLAQLGPFIHMKIDVPGGGMVGGPGGFRGPGGMDDEQRRRMMGGGGMRPGGPPGATQPPGDQPPGNQPPGNQPPGAPRRGFGSQSEAENIGTIKVEVGSHEKTVQLTVEVTLKEQAMEIMEKELAKVWVRAHGEIASATAPSTPHKLADALKAYREKNGTFPRGTFNRNPSADRQNRPWPPDQRISWMAEILPEMGYTEIFQKIDPQKSWRDDENLLPAMALIPEFLDGRNPNRSHFIHYPNMLSDVAVAATDFVGMAGVGMDAASYDEKDPEVTKKLGIFGYDRVTKVSDITDGLPSTILLIQVPPAYKNPWLAGGGATVRGCPETGSVKPFISEQPDGKKGTIAIMADGSVRFIPDNIPDDVFKAMCTIKGGEKVDLDKYTTLIAPPTEESQLETTSEPPPAPTKEEKKQAPKKEKKEDVKKEDTKKDDVKKESKKE